MTRLLVISFKTKTFFYCVVLNRLLSPPRKIMEERRERLNGLLLRGLYTVFKHPRLQTSSTRKAATENFLKSLNKPKDVLKLQGKDTYIYCLLFIIYYLCMKEVKKRLGFLYRLREVLTLKGHVESVVKLKGLDIDTIQQHYTV